MLKAILAFGLTRRAIILLGLLVFIAAGLVAFTKLNIEAYPNPAPVILEITAQAAGLSAEEMERYYTIPMEIGLYPTPGIDNIRSTSFYGLTFVRVTFKYGVDYFFAYTQAALSLQQNVTLPATRYRRSQQSSLVGEVYRYQVVGPPHFGLTNLRTVQDWIATRGLFTVTAASSQVNSWGGTTKQYDVDVDLHKLDAYNVTIPQIITALGNANINVGGREITVGQQSVNIRGIGLFDSGGNDDLTKGYHVNDIENVVLGQFNGVPVQVKDVAKVSVGYVPRLGIAGLDHDDDVALSIVVMGRTFHTNDVVPRIKAEIEKMNTDGELPPGVKLVPYYDRTRSRRRHHPYGAAQSHLRLRAGFPDPVDFSRQFAQRHHRRRQHSVRAVFRRHHHGADGTGRQPAFGRRRRLRHHRRFGGDPGREHFPEFPVAAGDRQSLLQQLAEGRFGADPTQLRRSAASSLDRSAAPDFGQRPSGRQGHLLLGADHGGGVRSLVHHAGGRRSDLQSHGANLRVGARRARCSRPSRSRRCWRRSCFPSTSQETETIVVRALHRIYTPVLHWSLDHRKTMLAIGAVFLVAIGLAGDAARQRVSAGAGRRQSVDPRVNAADDGTGGGRAGDGENARDPASSSGGASRRFPAWPARQRQRCFAVLQCRAVRAAQAVR